MPSFHVERRHPTCAALRFDGIGKGWEAWFLLRSDAHHDNLHCNQGLEKKHLEQARERDAGIIDIGDLYCAMQGRWDKRADQNQLRPELRVNNYTDALVEYNAEFYRPYARNFVLLSPGNHETGFALRNQTDLTERLAKELRGQGSSVIVGTYQGWVKFLFNGGKVKRTSRNLRYTHGYGGGGQVTKDIIQASRQLAYICNADIIISGHTHDALHVEVEREVLLDSGRPLLRKVDILKLGTYKDEYSQGGGWAVQKGFNPKSLGAWWLRFYYEDGDVCHEVLRAR